MSYEIPDFYVGVLPANVDMSDNGIDSLFQYSVVDVTVATATQGYGVGGAAIAPAPSAGVPALGIIQHNPQLGEACQVMSEGVSKAQVGANVAIGQLLMAAAPNGSGVSLLIPATSTNYAIARALETGSSGAIVAVYLRNFGKV